MGVIGRLKQLIRGPDDKLAAIVAGLDNQSKLLDTTLHGLIQGLDNQSRMLSQRLDRLLQEMDNQSSMLSQRLDRLLQGMDNQSSMLSQKIDRLIHGMDNQAGPSSERPNDIVQGTSTHGTIPAAAYPSGNSPACHITTSSATMVCGTLPRGRFPNAGSRNRRTAIAAALRSAISRCFLMRRLISTSMPSTILSISSRSISGRL
jgi:hypothetical protein